MTLKLWTNGFDTYVAERVEDIPALWEKHTGDKYCDEWHGDFVWEERVVEGDMLTLVVCDANENSERMTKTVAEWIAENGPGFLCSTEY